MTAVYLLAGDVAEARSYLRWLNTVAANYGITDVRRRPEREAALEKALLDADCLIAALAEAPPDVTSVLRTVLSAGGWCKLSRLERAYGSQNGDGMWWVHDPPSSTIGMARYLGLLYVGRTSLNGKRHLVAVIPAELREPLDAVLATADRARKKRQRQTR